MLPGQLHCRHWLGDATTAEQGRRRRRRRLAVSGVPPAAEWTRATAATHCPAQLDSCAANTRCTAELAASLAENNQRLIELQGVGGGSPELQALGACLSLGWY